MGYNVDTPYSDEATEILKEILPPDLQVDENGDYSDVDDDDDAIIDDVEEGGSNSATNPEESADEDCSDNDEDDSSDDDIIRGPCGRGRARGQIDEDNE